MNSRIVLAAVAGAIAISSASAEAQRRGRTLPRAEATPSISISPYAGYMLFGDIVDGPLSTSLSSTSAPVFGAQVNLPLGPSVSVVGNVGYSEPDLRFGLPILGGINFGKSQIWMYDAGLQVGAPILAGRRTISPFVQVGAGGMSHEVQVAGLSRKASNLAFTAALGADLPISENLGLRLFAKDYIGRFDVVEATGIDYEAKTSHNVALSAGLKLSF